MALGIIAALLGILIILLIPALFYLAFYLTYILTFYLASKWTYVLTFYPAFYQSNIYSGILSIRFDLPSILAFYSIWQSFCYTYTTTFWHIFFAF